MLVNRDHNVDEKRSGRGNVRKYAGFRNLLRFAYSPTPWNDATAFPL